MTKEEIVRALRVCEALGCSSFRYRGSKEQFCVDALIRDAIDLIEAQAAEIEKLKAQVPRWIPVTERLPESEKEVMIRCSRGGYIFACPAIYEYGTVLTKDSAWNWYEIDSYAEYSEETDDYFVPKGWWESRHFTPDDVYNNPVDCEVTHWMPLPGVEV